MTDTKREDNIFCAKLTDNEVVNFDHGTLHYDIKQGDIIFAHTFHKEDAEMIANKLNLHDELVEVINDLIKVYNEPDGAICCNGIDCGCYGSSVRQQAEHYARETLKKAGAL